MIWIHSARTPRPNRNDQEQVAKTDAEIMAGSRPGKQTGRKTYTDRQNLSIHEPCCVQHYVQMHIFESLTFIHVHLGPLSYPYLKFPPTSSTL